MLREFQPHSFAGVQVRPVAWQHLIFERQFSVSDGDYAIAAHSGFTAITEGARPSVSASSDEKIHVC